LVPPAPEDLGPTVRRPRGGQGGQADPGMLVRKVTALQKSYSSALRHPKLP